jgi:hypothetical protein
MYRQMSATSPTYTTLHECSRGPAAADLVLKARTRSPSIMYGTPNRLLADLCSPLSVCYATQIGHRRLYSDCET